MNTENPDQTPTTEADAFETSLGHAVTQYRMAEAVAKIRTLEHQRNIVRAEATEARDKLESRTRGMLARINDLNAQLSESRSTLRATRDADHGAAIEAADYYWLCRMMAADAEQELCKNGTDTSCDQTSLCVTEYCIPCAARAWMNDQRRLEALPVTNSQQKGGEEPCPKQQVPMTSANSGSNAAPASDPDGAATAKETTVRRPYAICPRCDCRIDMIGLCGCDNIQL